jgi:hypothetical protein
MTIKWLSRLAFSFIIVGGALAWEGSKQTMTGRQIVCFIGAAVLLALGIAGLRERHRPRP